MQHRPDRKETNVKSATDKYGVRSSSKSSNKKWKTINYMKIKKRRLNVLDSQVAPPNGLEQWHCFWKQIPPFSHAGEQISEAIRAASALVYATIICYYASGCWYICD